jgi:hypothetical protein
MTLKSIIRWWERLRTTRSLQRVVLIESMTELPATLASNLYVVRRAGYDRRAVFNCPCRCGRRIDLNLVRSHSPYWSLILTKGKATIHPSVWLEGEPCQSHFFIRDSKVVWV